MTVILFLIIGLLTQANAFAISEELACNSNPLRANKSPAYVTEATDFTDDVYQIGNSALLITTGSVTSLYEILLLKGGNTYKAHAIGSDLSIINQTYTSTANTVLLDVVDHIIFVKEFTDPATFKFAAYLFDASNLASGALKRVQIDPLTFPTGDKRVGLQFNKVLGYDQTSNTLYVVMSNAGYTEIHTKVLATDGPFETQIPVVDSNSVISVGNSKLMFDNSVKKYYRFTTEGNSFEALTVKTAADGTEFGPILYSDLQYYRLTKDTFAITSYSGSSGNIKASFGIFDLANLVGSGDDGAGTGTYTPVIHYNQYNFVFISENLFSFSRYNSRMIYSNLDLSSLTVQELAEAKNDFKNGMRVAFNAEKQFILSDRNIIIYELSYNTAGTELQSMNKLASLQLSSEVAGMILDDSSKWIKLRIRCSCAKVLVTKLKCFSSKFKCLGINSYIADDCTVPYNDDVAQFAASS